MLKKLVLFVCLAALTFLGLNANASIVISTTRIIFNQEKGEGLVQLANKGDAPLLVQAWIDDGDANADPSAIQVPFSMMPSTVRIDPEKGQAIRIFIGSQADLPQDRESLFWFNIIEIPPKPTHALASGENFMQIAIRTRVKLFYRPSSLKISSMDAYDLLSFDVKKVNAGYVIVVKNPTPYHINFSQLELRLSDKKIIAAQMPSTESKILKPFSETKIPVPDLKLAPPAGAEIFYLIINDTGGTTSGRRVLP